MYTCLLILRCLCNCAQCDYGLFGGGLSVIVNNVFTFSLVTVLTLLFTFLLNCGFVSFLCNLFADNYCCALVIMHHVMLAFTVVSSTL